MSEASGRIVSLEWTGSTLRAIDQRLLPDRLVFLELDTADAVIEAIVSLAIRGANVLGIAGAFGFALGVAAGEDPLAVAARVIAARPTAVALERFVTAALDEHLGGGDAFAAAQLLLEGDRRATARLSENGRIELAGKTRILTHCNTGVLATAGQGTALGVIYAKHEAGEPVEVYATETRPVGQGRRLTVWELRQAGIDVTLLPDTAAAALLASGQIDAVIVGADRVTKNGDTANKVGTLGLALAAKHAGVPFYVAATMSAFDTSLEGPADIPIEFRDGDEVRAYGPGTVPAEVPVWNPAFDVTPWNLITGVITETEVLYPPFSLSTSSVPR